MLVGTDVVEVGEMKVGSDGGYLIADGWMIKTDEPFQEPV